MHYQIHTSILQCPQSDWNALTEPDVPFFDHEFLSALELSSCVGGKSGWEPLYVCFYEQEKLVAAIPLYLKSHSYGEFIFDFQWAQAYHHYGFDYYPKIVSAIPVTPVTCKRLLSLQPDFFSSNPSIFTEVLSQIQKTYISSSIHFLFCTQSEAQWFSDFNFHKRITSNFRWHNRGYRDFEDFLTQLKRKERQQIQKERRAIQQSGLTIQKLTGLELNEDIMSTMHELYLNHHHNRYGSPTYLNRDFFLQIYRHMPNSTMVIVARNSQNNIVAGSLNFYKGKGLYGRYWGFFEDHKYLHFELCYYQQIEFAIDHQMTVFDGGAQGEHKLKRGLDPFTVYSSHWLGHTGFHEAIGKFIEQETKAVKTEQDRHRGSSAYKAID